METPALTSLTGTDLAYDIVATERARSPQESARLQRIDVGNLVRTLVVRRGEDDYVFILVPGGREIDWAKLRTHLGVRRVSLPDEGEARAATGYERGAITPLGASRAWPVIADATLTGLGRIAIGGGAHGVNLHLEAADLLGHLGAKVADVSRPARGDG